MPVANRFALNKAIILVIIAMISIAWRAAQELVSRFSFRNDLVTTNFEAKIVDGLNIEDCPQFNSYNLILFPGLNDAQKAGIESNCQKILSKNLSATFDETVYNISKLKGFGVSSAQNLAKIIWKKDG